MVAESTQRQILERLNGPENPSTKRVASFIRLFQEARRLSAGFESFFATERDEDIRDVIHDFLYESPKLSQYQNHRAKFSYDYPRPGSTGYTFSVPEIQAYNERMNQVLSELYKLTSRYKWYPVVTLHEYGADFLVVQTLWKSRSELESWENYTMSWLCAHNGKWIGNFRKCRQCQKWLFAVAEHQHYCSNACRQRHASQSDEFKENRRLYMRDFRRREKERQRKVK